MVDVHAEEPLGLLYLAAYLREHNKDVEILDAYQGMPSVSDSDGFFKSGLSDKEIERKINEYSPDLVGITCMFSIFSKGAHDIARIVKRVSKDILVVFGGVHSSSFTDLVLSDENVDMVVMGEGEETLLEIVKRLDAKKPLTGIQGTTYKEDGQIVFHSHKPLIQDIDSLPLPAWDLLDMDIYLNDAYRNRFSMTPPRLNVITSRGCPFNCVYCGIHTVWRNKYRPRTPNKVGEELEYLKKNYGIGEVAFMDDNLTFHEERIGEICDEIIRRKLNIRWCTPNGVAIWTLKKSLLDKMKKSGCYKLTFGIETGSRKTQKFIRKSQIDLEKSKEVIKYCNKIGLWTHSAFIIGFINETKADIEETIEYATSTDLDIASFFIATPFPGTDLFKIYQEEGLIPRVDNATALKWNALQWRAMCDTKFFTKGELVAMLGEAYRRFYISRIPKFLNPLRLLRKCTDVDEIRFSMKLLTNFRATVNSMS
ncbi:MAG: B12-binding domain-containing radical SAM protein [bacterium]